MITSRSTLRRTRHRSPTFATTCIAAGSWTTTNSPPTSSCTPIKAPSTRDWRAQRGWDSGKRPPTPSLAASCGKRAARTRRLPSMIRSRPALAVIFSASRCFAWPACCSNRDGTPGQAGGGSWAPRSSRPPRALIASPTAGVSRGCFPRVLRRIDRSGRGQRGVTVTFTLCAIFHFVSVAVRLRGSSVAMVLARVRCSN